MQFSVEGLVVDAKGQPIEGVNIGTGKTQCDGKTTSNGRFSLRCGSALNGLVFSHSDYFQQTIPLEREQEKHPRVPTTTLVQIPRTDGLFFFKDKRFVDLKDGSLFRTTQQQGQAKRRRYCVDKEASTPNPIKAGMTRFADKNAPPWRLFRLDEAGCAYRDAKDTEGRWVVEYKNRPTLARDAMDDGLVIIEGTLDIGEYFLADWSGFFVPTPTEDAHYSGRWIRVDG